ncbi:MAG TPA: M10 family metallopeptidase C-terminal domain-containing protein, partial [Methylomirabilota bacterium]|nr:M10 family metallopeptidase C-terminal domain-containing protein [Methylomirabilota bacterium]
FIYLKASDSRPGNAKRDVITDFDGKADRIDLSKVDANSRKKGLQRFTFIGARRFSGRPGELRYAKGLLQGNLNRDRRPEFEIKVIVKHGKLTKKRLKLK